MTTAEAAPVAPGDPRGAQERPTGWRRHRHRHRLNDLLLSAVVVLGAGAVVVGDLATGVSAVTWWRVVLTLALAAGLWWRRRHPLLLAWAACAGVVLGTSALVLPVAVLTLAVRRRDRVLVPVVAAAEVALLTDFWRAGLPDGVAAMASSAVLSGAVFIGMPLAVAAYLGARHDLVVSLRERAVRAETEQLLRVEQAQLAERTRIAREMHDVLGHRITLVAQHAGALEVKCGCGGSGHRTGGRPDRHDRPAGAGRPAGGPGCAACRRRRDGLRCRAGRGCCPRPPSATSTALCGPAARQASPYGCVTTSYPGPTHRRCSAARPTASSRKD